MGMWARFETPPERRGICHQGMNRFRAATARRPQEVGKVEKTLWESHAEASL